MNLKSTEHSTNLKNEIMKIYSQHDFQTKFYAFLRLKLCPIMLISQYVPEEGKILDLGTGVGLFANLLCLESSKREVFGIDHSEKRIQIAQKVSNENSLLKFSVGDVNNISIGQYNILTLIDLLHHMPFSEQEELLRKIYSRLNRQGILIIKDLEKHPYWKYLFHYVQDSISYKLSKLYFRSTKEMEKLLEDIGFKAETISLSAGYPHPHVLYRCIKTHA
jgi:2-polyprenyl-3-methyl-5-hydroxy-6-metoxy-1,4-benzoquinol methylase